MSRCTASQLVAACLQEPASCPPTHAPEALITPAASAANLSTSNQLQAAQEVQPQAPNSAGVPDFAASAAQQPGKGFQERLDRLPAGYDDTLPVPSPGVRPRP